MNAKLVLINQTTLEALEDTEPVQIIERFIKTGLKVLGADFGFMYWKLENQDKYHLIYTSPGTPYAPKHPKKGRNNDKAYTTKVPYFVTNPTKDLRPYMKSFVVIPIFYKEHQYGNIVLCFKKPRVFKLEENSLTTTFGNSVAQVLTIHRAHKKVEKDSLKLLKQKDEFFNIVSHELKTPVTTIKGFAQILNTKLEKTDKNTKYFLDKINSQADRLTHLINDLLDVSRIETGKLRFKKVGFELQTLTAQVIEGLKVAITTHPISFESESQLWVRGDNERIEEVIINLITNAVKYSPVGSKIKVTLQEKEEKAYLAVEDFGYGISEKDKSKVFTRFFQSKSSHRENIVGLGLGLYIANSIVKHHGGVLGFKSKKNNSGTIFYFSLPYYRSQPNKKFLK